MTKEIQINGFTFILHTSGAMFWEEEGLLIISDVHLGKISHFRKHGSAIPAEAIGGNFRKLNQVVKYFDPVKICFLGDLFHSAINQEWGLFEAWVASVPSEILLIEGNHDIISPHKYEALNVKLASEKTIHGFIFTHEPMDTRDLFNICGHIHPGFELTGLGRQKIKLPCYFKTRSQMILPAFGEFTGKHILSGVRGGEVYVIAGEEVILVRPKNTNSF